MTNSEIEPFPSFSPSQRTNNYKIILINYRWDGELMLEEGAVLFQTIFPSPAAFPRHKKPLAAGEGSGLGLQWIIIDKKKSIG